VETPSKRVWLAEFQMEDGMWCDNCVTKEIKNKKGDWIQVEQYEAA